VPFGNLLPPAPWQGVQTCRVAGAGERTTMVCGYLKCDELLFNSVLRRLPPLFTVRPRPGPAADWVQACVRYALDEGMQRRAGSDAMMARLPELLFVESLRLYAEQLGPAETGWLAALRDPVLSCALTRLHAAPARKWTVALLAEAIASSRSVLDERFRTLLGQAPMHYLAEWRMQLAADLLRGTRQKLAAIAEQVGYQSEEAFSRAFRRHLGRSPGEWRDRAPA
jgi:AraC-like DNA-binding protein